MPRFAIFINDPDCEDEFIGVARVDTQGDDEPAARQRAVNLHGEHRDGGHGFSLTDVAFGLSLAEPKSPLVSPATSSHREMLANARARWVLHPVSEPTP